MDELRNGLDSVMAQNNNIANSNIKQELKENSDNYIKNLLNKMDYVINDKPKKKAEPKETKKKVLNQTKIKDGMNQKTEYV